jgi:hypothetical protein
MINPGAPSTRVFPEYPSISVQQITLNLRVSKNKKMSFETGLLKRVALALL